MDISKLTLQLNNLGKDKTFPKQILDIRYKAPIYQDFRQSFLKFIQQKKKYNKTNFDQNLMAFALLCAGEFKEPEFAEKINKVFDLNDEKFSFERKPMLCPLLVFAKGIFCLRNGKRLQAATILLKVFYENPFLFSIKDLSDLIELTWDLGEAKHCHNVLAFTVENYKDSLTVRLRLVQFQLEADHIFPEFKNQNLINHNLSVLYKRCKSANDFFSLANLCYVAGLENDFYHCYEKAFLNLKLSDFQHSFTTSAPPPPLQNFSAEECLRTTNDLLTEIEKTGEKAFLIGGTLLGLYRDGKLMDYDKDADLGIFIAGTTRDEHIKQIRNLVEKICQSGRFVAPWLNIKKPEFTEFMTCVIDKTNGILVDLFFFYKYQGKVLSGIHTKMAPLLWVDEPFEVVKHKFPGHDFEYYVPSDIDLFLENLFGTDWRTPIPVWDSLVKCPNLARSSQKAVFYYGVGRFYQALENHKYLKAADYYDLLSNRWKYPFSAEMKSHIENLLQQLKGEFENTKQNQKK